MSEHTVATRAPFYPIFLRLADRPVLVVGGNIEAERKIRRLALAGADLRIVAENLTPDLQSMWEASQIDWIACSVAADHLQSVRLIVVADAVDEIRDWLITQATDRGMPINVVDQRDYCSAIVPSVVDRSPLMVAIGSQGTAPELARMTRSRIETMLPPHTGELAALLGSLQEPLRSRFPDPTERRHLLNWAFAGPPAALVADGKMDAAEHMIRARLNDSDYQVQGEVALVGAGPGDPELLTLRALRRIQVADVLIYDGLVDDRVLGYARRDATFIDVSKRPSGCKAKQDDIHHLMIEHAQSGARVVRLQGGDPLVFGRAGEELAVLREAGIQHEVVPGVTSASGCAASLAMPLTQRGLSQSVRLVTAHCEDSIDSLDWQSLAADRQTLVFYMAVARVQTLEKRLLDNGRGPTTPVAIVERGSYPDERRFTGKLRQLTQLCQENDIAAPALFFVGEVAAEAVDSTAATLAERDQSVIT